MQLELRKLLLYGLLAFICVTLFQKWMIFSQENDINSSSNPSGQEALVDEGIPDLPKVVESTDNQAIPVDNEIETADTVIDEKNIINVSTDLVNAKINRIGGEIIALDLIKHPVSVDKKDQPFQLLKSGGTDKFTAQTGLIGKQKRNYPNHKTQFNSAEDVYQLHSGEDTLEVALNWQSDDGVVYNKIIRFYRNSYKIDIDYQIQNQSTSNWQGYLYAQFQRTNVQTEQFGLFGGSPTYKGGVIYTPGEKYQKIDFGDIEKDKLNVVTDSGWVGMLQHYFVGAWIPTTQSPYQFYSKQLNQSVQPFYNIGYKTTAPLTIDSGQTKELGTSAYIGPKEHERLKAQNVEGLILTVDYGWLTAIASPLFWLMNEIYQFVKNWGWTIVIVTILLKLLFFPLSAASYKSMAKMKKFQPRLMTLRERYADDKQKLNMEMMKLYKQEKINPMGGCLPILIQIPVFIALYWVLLESVELRQAPFILWIKDLSLKDPYFVLPVLYGISMFVMQKLNPAPIDPIQQKVMMFLPLVFTILFLWFPSGLVLYWLVNNILSMGQQYYITKKYA